MRKIELTQGKYALVDDEDFERINKCKWCAHRHGNGWRATRGIRKANGKQRTQYMHRIIISVPNGLEIDHRNHNGLDNRKSNLRVCTHAENLQNQQQQKPRQGTSKFKGVNWHNARNKWRAYIKSNDKFIHLGVFDNEIDAAKAYDKKAKELFGEYAYLNFGNNYE